MAKISTHDTESFRRRYMNSGKLVNELLKPAFGKFFIVKVEDLLRQIKLPVPPNRAETHTMIYLTAGEANIAIGSESYCIKKDECLIVPAGQVFSFSKPDVNKGYLCNFHNDFIVGRFGKKELLKEFEFLNVYAHPCITLGAAVSKNVLQLLRRVYELYYGDSNAETGLAHAYFMAVLGELKVIYQPHATGKTSQSTTITNRFRQLLLSNIKHMHRVADYAAALHVTPNHLNKAVKSATGKPPTKWIDETLILEAKVLLYQADLTIGEVAAEIGLLDQSYFSRMFRKYEGLTPQQFRARIEKS